MVRDRDVYPPRELCTAVFTLEISSVSPGETHGRVRGQTKDRDGGDAPYRLLGDAGCWTGTAAGRPEASEDSEGQQT